MGYAQGVIKKGKDKGQLKNIQGFWGDITCTFKTQFAFFLLLICYVLYAMQYAYVDFVELCLIIILN